MRESHEILAVILAPIRVRLQPYLSLDHRLPSSDSVRRPVCTAVLMHRCMVDYIAKHIKSLPIYLKYKREIRLPALIIHCCKFEALIHRAHTLVTHVSYSECNIGILTLPVSRRASKYRVLHVSTSLSTSFSLISKTYAYLLW